MEEQHDEDKHSCTQRRDDGLGLNLLNLVLGVREMDHVYAILVLGLDIYCWQLESGSSVSEDYKVEYDQYLKELEHHFLHCRVLCRLPSLRHFAMTSSYPAEEKIVRLQAEFYHEPTSVEWAEALGINCWDFQSQHKSGKSCQDKLIYANFRMVVRIAKQYQGHGLSLPDLLQVYLESISFTVSTLRSGKTNLGFTFIKVAPL
ncbi:hypothetical protein RJ641_028171 [Dillenia turbinata]|uniref:Uncharacterized protein n=1 Tax=Dillenia turbinata TaxID=194707 RepID=A0AAN8ZIS2_9MAGN